LQTTGETTFYTGKLALFVHNDLTQITRARYQYFTHLRQIYTNSISIL